MVAYQISSKHNQSMRSWVIDDSTNFPGPFWRRFPNAGFSRLGGPNSYKVVGGHIGYDNNCIGHWLLVIFRIDYTKSQRLLTRFWRKAVHTLSDNLSLLHTFPTPALHQPTAIVNPTTRTVISSSAFSRAALAIWNSLPHDIRAADSFGRFRQTVTAYSSLLTRISLTLHVNDRLHPRLFGHTSTYWRVIKNI